MVTDTLRNAYRAPNARSRTLGLFLVFFVTFSYFSSAQAAFIIDDDDAYWDADVGLEGGGVIPAALAQLFRVYFGALGRLPDTSGFAWWSTEIEEGRLNLDGVAEGFYNSPEFRDLADSNSNGSVSDSELINHMYLGVFGREPDPPGFEWWLEELESDRRSPADVLVEMTQSNEYVLLTLDAVASFLPDGAPDTGGSPAPAAAYPEPAEGPWIAPGAESRMPKLTFEGAWRHRRGRWNELNDISSMKGGFAVTGDSVWLTNNRTKTKAVGKFKKPVPALTTDISKMPIAELETEFFPVEPEGTQGAHLSDVYYDEALDKVYVSINVFYDAQKTNRDFIAVMDPDGRNKQGYFNVTNRQMASGQILRTPYHLIDRVGGRLYMHPEHWTNIISRVSTGAGLHGWDGIIPAERGATIPLTPHLYYPHTQTPGEHLAAGCRRPANPIFNRLSRYEVSFFWKDSYISIGLNQGQEGGIAYGVPPYGVHKGNYTCIKNDKDNYFWIWDQDDIFNSSKPWSAKPVEWGFLEPHAPEAPWIIGAFFDSLRNKLYLLGLNDNLQASGEWNPVIYQYGVSD